MQRNGKILVGDSEGNEKIHWIDWKKLSEVKGRGGLDFRDL